MVFELPADYGLTVSGLPVRGLMGSCPAGVMFAGVLGVVMVGMVRVCPFGQLKVCSMLEVSGLAEP